MDQQAPGTIEFQGVEFTELEGKIPEKVPQQQTQVKKNDIILSLSLTVLAVPCQGSVTCRMSESSDSLFILSTARR